MTAKHFFVHEPVEADISELSFLREPQFDPQFHQLQCTRIRLVLSTRLIEAKESSALPDDRNPNTIVLYVDPHQVDAIKQFLDEEKKKLLP